ncbi:MAG: hypothetical protein COT85_05995 [Chlamydiae bacterium CG10_big_fil_rev_8_21_14_0_10_42_34]|nr:MAG: hypothetical protein COT85_05995 [Chlamydiae bacterium CG10_big_fil_rev_8_21_14_0_10_42_34]
MVINNVNLNNPSQQPPQESVWQKLNNDFMQIEKLLADMKEHPQNAIHDLDKVIHLAKEMDKLAKNSETSSSKRPKLLPRL